MTDQHAAEVSGLPALALTEPFDLGTTFVHLGKGGTATTVPEFSFEPTAMRKYLVRFARDRDDGRLVGMMPMQDSWNHWECHVNGDELVVVLAGRCDVIQEIGDGCCVKRALGAGQAIINRRGVWHTSDVEEPGSTLFVVSGRRTDYRPR